MFGLKIFSDWYKELLLYRAPNRARKHGKENGHGKDMEQNGMWGRGVVLGHAEWGHNKFGVVFMW